MMEFAFVEARGFELATAADLPEGNAPWPTVIMVHGLTGQRMGKQYHFVEFARRLNERGIACVRFDQAGCGESTGRFVDLTIPRMVTDARAVRDWTLSQPWCDGEAMGWVGVSLGAVATVAVEAERPGAAVALWAGVYDMPRVFAQTARTGLRGLLSHQGWVPYRGLQIGANFVDTMGQVDVGAALAASDAPLLVCHSQADEAVSFAESDAYVQRCEAVGRPCRREVFTTADHDFSEYGDRQQLLGVTGDFMVDHLRGNEGEGQAMQKNKGKGGGSLRG
mgnify:CR=1 FL=1